MKILLIHSLRVQIAILATRSIYIQYIHTHTHTHCSLVKGRSPKTDALVDTVDRETT